nr:hypothetical protein CFP56_03085 [Quercus suber]
METEQTFPGKRCVEDGSPSSPSIHPILLDLIARAKTLLSELERFRVRLRSLRHEGCVELGHFRSTVQSELGMLERLSQRPNDASTQHIARSSNLPFLETVWITVKKSREVTALQKRIYTTSSVKLLSQGLRHVHLDRSSIPVERGPREGAVIVDAITDAGRTWTKVSLTTNTRLLFDLAKLGWESGGSDSEDDDVHLPPRSNEDDDHDVPLVKTARELVKAAQLFRVRGRTPVIHLVLPRIELGEADEVDAIIDDCRAAGVTVFCGADIQPVPLIDEALLNMAPNPTENFSDVLNIDCTILLALVSEFSHAKVSKEPWFHAALRRQVEIEGNENLLPALLYPAMGSRRLVCTREAVSRMREIVDAIGTPSEKARTVIMLGDDPTKAQPQLIQEMQTWSAYPVPQAWRLPIQVIDFTATDGSVIVPDEAKEICARMTDINRSVFLSGWALKRTTITSNRTVVKQIEHDLEAYTALSDDVWPDIWLCPTARSLVGKEKRGIPKNEVRPESESKEGKKSGRAWLLPDPLRREEQRRNGLDVLSQREGRKVEDLRPDGYPCEEVLEAKNASIR